MTKPTYSTWSAAADINDAPPAFQWQGKSVVPVEFSEYRLALDIDVPNKRAVGRAEITFVARQRGRPLLDMVPEPRKVVVDGKVADFPEVVPPDNQAPVRVLDVEVEAGSHKLAIEYDLTANTISFNNGVQLGLFMTDRKIRGYLERHAPANLDFNQFPLTVSISVAGASTPPRLFTNGKAATSGNAWEVTFPAHFSSSSFFLHLSDRAFQVQNDSFNGKNATIPLLAYGLSPDAPPQAIATAKSVLAELESTYGAYAHDRLTMYISGGGGMEYCGATMTSLGSLPHEILHSWFGRGVMPGSGNAGWIDEGIAQWRDNQYPTRAPDPEREPTQLSGFSPYQRHTLGNAYDDGSLLFSELDHLFGQGGGKGLRPVLGELYREKKLQQITTEFLKSFLESQTGHDLGAMFDRFVYGRDEGPPLSLEARIERRSRSAAVLRQLEAVAPPTPRGFTFEELNALR